MATRWSWIVAALVLVALSIVWDFAMEWVALGRRRRVVDGVLHVVGIRRR